MTAVLARVENLYARAAGSWTGADWTHELITEDCPANPDEPTAYCEGGTEGCLTCASATGDAEEAEILAAEAIEFVRAGDYTTAEVSANAAYALEMAYGDAPTWGKFRTALVGLASIR